MNCISLLKDQHRAIEGLFASLHDARDAKARERALDALAAELLDHLGAEERVLYAAMEDLDAAAVEAGLREHEAIRRQLADLARVRPTTAAFTAGVDALAARFHRHAKDEDERLFVSSRRCLGIEMLEDLALDLSESLPAHPG